MSDERRVSIKDFGAVGDGVADDSAAWLEAINDLLPEGGALFLPPGTYDLTLLELREPIEDDREDS